MIMASGRRLGVEAAFGLMRDDTAVFATIPDTIGVRFHGARHGNDAIDMAEGHAAASGKFGVAEIRPDATTVLVVGDGGFVMTMDEFETGIDPQGLAAGHRGDERLRLWRRAASAADVSAARPQDHRHRRRPVHGRVHRVRGTEQ